MRFPICVLLLQLLVDVRGGTSGDVAVVLASGQSSTAAMEEAVAIEKELSQARALVAHLESRLAGKRRADHSEHAKNHEHKISDDICMATCSYCDNSQYATKDGKGIGGDFICHDCPAGANCDGGDDSLSAQN